MLYTIVGLLVILYILGLPEHAARSESAQKVADRYQRASL